MTNDNKLTTRQKDILTYIKKYIAENNYSPSIREIGKGNNLSSSATVHAHLNNLIKKGYIKKEDSKFRTIEIIGENEFIKNNNSFLTLPLISDTDIYPNSLNNPIKKIEISNKISNINSNSFLLKVTNQHIFNANDILIINRDIIECDNNSYVAVLENNLIKIKLYNPFYNNVIGKVVSLYRIY